MLDCPPPPLHMEGFRHLSAPVWFCYSSALSAWQMFAWKFPNQSALASRCSPCIHWAFYCIVYGEQHCPHSRMKTAMQRGCLCWKVPAWSPCLGTEGWEEGSGGITGPSASTDWAYLTWLTPKVPPKEPTRLPSSQSSTQKPFPPASHACPQLHVILLCTFAKQHPPCKDFRLKSPSILAHRSNFGQRKKATLKQQLHFGVFKSVLSVRTGWRFIFCNTCSKHYCI